MDRKHRLLKAMPLGIALVAVLVLIGVGWLVRVLVNSKDHKPPRVVQTITVIRPPPPPPDQPPPPPPPTPEDQPIPQDQPEPQPDDQQAPSQQLGLDAEGSAGSDAFGLAARKGGHDITGSGHAIFAWYTGQLKDRLLDQLSDDARLRARHFNVTVRVYIESDGRIESVKLASSSGNRDIDDRLEAALHTLKRMPEPPPLEMPQPVFLRIVSRS